MNNDKNKTEWKAVRGKIKSTFSRLSEAQIDGLEGHMDKLNSTVKKAYSYDQTKTDKECKAFNENLKKCS
ncbi:MAG: hypothetical protein ACJAT2_003421 [Bacteriovoracaceae bacterium]|jgi:uncharacterized protein YjbJ (UPF0337 family)